jgi:hypothetical protein
MLLLHHLLSKICRHGSKGLTLPENMPIDKVVMEKASWGAAFQTVNGCAAHSSRRVITRRPKI